MGPNPRDSKPFTLHPHMIYLAIRKLSVPSRSWHLDMVNRRDKAGTRALWLLCWRVALTPVSQ